MMTRYLRLLAVGVVCLLLGIAGVVIFGTPRTLNAEDKAAPAMTPSPTFQTRAIHTTKAWFAVRFNSRDGAVWTLGPQ
jgi:hypothetical protein